MSDPFREDRPVQAASVGQYHVPNPTTPTRGHGFLQNQTPSRDAFASITSPHHLQIILTESELINKSLRQDLKLAREELKQRADEVATLKNEIEILKMRVGQQKVTIRTQSRTIQDPRTLRTAHPFAQQPPNGHQLLPHAHPNPFVQATVGAPIPYPGNQPAAGHLSGQRGLDGHTAGAGPKRLLEPLVLPMKSALPTTGMPDATQQTAMTTTNSMSVEATSTFLPSPFQSSPFQSSPLSGYEFETKAADFGGRFRALWSRAEQFAKIYTNKIVEIQPDYLPASLRDQMMLSDDEDIAMEYLNNSIARRLYVSKVINFYLCKRILKYTEIVRGFDSGIDSEINQLKRLIVHDTPPVARHALLSGISQQVINARGKPRFSDFQRGGRDAHSYQLRMILDPLLFVRDRDFSAQEMLMDIIAEAQTLGLDLYSCPYDARFHFPELDETFDPTCMVHMGSQQYGTMPHVNKDAKITLSVTPFIRLGLNSSDPARVRNVCNAKIYTKLPGDEEEAISLTPGRLP